MPGLSLVMILPQSTSSVFYKPNMSLSMPVRRYERADVTATRWIAYPACSVVRMPTESE